MFSPRSTSYFYPRPPGGGRLLVASIHRAAAKISIHALRVEGDQPLRLPRDGGHYISIHALRVEGDIGLHCHNRRGVISIHALRVEGDLRVVLRLQAVVQFLSTPSGWRATSKPAGQPSKSPISIHALRVEGDGHHHG